MFILQLAFEQNSLLGAWRMSSTRAYRPVMRAAAQLKGNVAPCPIERDHETTAERIDLMGTAACALSIEKPDHRHGRLLRTQRERPDRRTAKQGDELQLAIALIQY
jgi:hypothetical protein